jgi:hypothetical protein
MKHGFLFVLPQRIRELTEVDMLLYARHSVLCTYAPAQHLKQSLSCHYPYLQLRTLKLSWNKNFLLITQGMAESLFKLWCA